MTLHVKLPLFASKTGRKNLGGYLLVNGSVPSLKILSFMDGICIQCMYQPHQSSYQLYYIMYNMAWHGVLWASDVHCVCGS
jgi:hypothetical protein